MWRPLQPFRFGPVHLAHSPRTQRIHRKQGQNYERYESGEVVTPDTVHYSPGLKHCIHPAFMRDQLTRSLDRLGLESLDVFLLHNPEYYLTHSVKAGAGPEELARHRAEMQRRIFDSFKALEEEISIAAGNGGGRIRGYGISSNSFSLSPEHPHFLSYDNLVELAERVRYVYVCVYVCMGDGSGSQLWKP